LSDCSHQEQSSSWYWPGYGSHNSGFGWRRPVLRDQRLIDGTPI
jgi:hypothetical protein